MGDTGRQPFAASGEVRASTARWIGEDGCTLTVPPQDFECGRTLNITVTLDPEQIEAAATLMLKARRDAMARGSGFRA